MTAEQADRPDHLAGKKVALVIGSVVGRSGGAERIFVELANMLAARGYQVSCLTLEKEDGRPFYPLDPRVELVNVAPRYRPRRRPWLKWLTSKRAPESIRNAAEWHLKNDHTVRLLRDYFKYSRPDVAISFLPPANTPTLLASRGTGVKVIPTNHNVPEKDYRDPRRWSSNPHDRKLRLSALRHAALIHTLFREFADWFPDSLQNRMVVVHNYVSNDVLRYRPVPERDKVVLAVGRLAPVKNYPVLVEAWSQIADRFPQWRLVIYGDGPHRDRLAELIDRLGVKGSVELAGHRTDMGEVYARSSIFCHPALFEGFGLAPAEALALKMPVIAFSDCAGVNQFVKNDVNGLMVGRAAGATGLAAALEKLMSDPGLLSRLGEAGPESVATFTEEHFANAWVELIERCTANG